MRSLVFLATRILRSATASAHEWLDQFRRRRRVKNYLEMPECSVTTTDVQVGSPIHGHVSRFGHLPFEEPATKGEVE